VAAQLLARNGYRSCTSVANFLFRNAFMFHFFKTMMNPVKSIILLLKSDIFIKNN
jgi:hypothetical protein